MRRITRIQTGMIAKQLELSANVVSAFDGHVQVAKVNQGPGHGGPSQAGWDRHLERALAMWQE